MKNRAYSLLTIKNIDEEQRLIAGIASTPDIDSYGDVLEPMGASYKLPIPLLWSHQVDKPVGEVRSVEVTKEGISFVAHIAKIEEEGVLKDRTNEAWHSVKSGLVKGVSVGFKPVSTSPLPSGKGILFKKWDWFELSLVTVPANSQATIQLIRSIDQGCQAASGPSDTPVKTKTVASALAQSKHTGIQMTNLERMAAFQAKRTAAQTRMAAIMEAAGDNTLDAEQTQEYDDLAIEIKSIGEHLVRLQECNDLLAKSATPVTGKTADEGTASRQGVVVSVKPNLPKGTAFVRYAGALARSKGNLFQAVELAKAWHDTTPEVETVLRAAVSVGTTTDANWAKPLVEYQNMTSEFIDLLRPATIIGNIQGLRRVPFNVKIPGQTGASSVNWVGEGKAKPVSGLSFNSISLGFAKLAGIVVITDELAKFSSPSAEALVRDDLIKSISAFQDKAFIDPTKAAVTDVSPASVTNGVTGIASSGVDLDAVKTDVKAAFGKFIAANLTPESGVWLMSATTALALSLMTNPLGQYEYPKLTMRGGEFHGLPVVVSEQVGNMLVLLNASDILLADEGGIMLDTSSEASLEMSDTPDGTASLVSLWQNNLLGIRAERFINWRRRRAEAVAVISGVAYGTTPTGP